MIILVIKKASGGLLLLVSKYTYWPVTRCTFWDALPNNFGCAARDVESFRSQSAPLSRLQHRLVYTYWTWVYISNFQHLFSSTLTAFELVSAQDKGNNAMWGLVCEMFVPRHWQPVNLLGELLRSLTRGQSEFGISILESILHYIENDQDVSHRIALLQGLQSCLQESNLYAAALAHNIPTIVHRLRALIHLHTDKHTNIQTDETLKTSLYMILSTLCMKLGTWHNILRVQGYVASQCTTCYSEWKDYHCSIYNDKVASTCTYLDSLIENKSDLSNLIDFGFVSVPKIPIREKSLTRLKQSDSRSPSPSKISRSPSPKKFDSLPRSPH